VTIGAGPISLASGEPPCAAQHGPHTTERNTVGRARPTRTRHVTHNSVGTSGDRVATSSAGSGIPAAVGSALSAPAEAADGTAAQGGVSGA
jgi:hypothetical protein